MTSQIFEEAPRSFEDLAHDAADVIEAANRPQERAGARLRSAHGDNAGAERDRDIRALAWEVERLARQVAEMAQRLAGDSTELEVQVNLDHTVDMVPKERPRRAHRPTSDGLPREDER